LNGNSGTATAAYSTLRKSNKLPESIKIGLYGNLLVFMDRIAVLSFFAIRDRLLGAGLQNLQFNRCF
jgi:hypothetical protein